MATPAELVNLIAKILDMPVRTVITHDRNLAKAKLRTVGGRGTGAARMTGRDAARLLIAAATCENIKDSVANVKMFGSFTSSAAVETGIARFDQLPAKHSFGDALAALIDAAAKREIAQSDDVHFAIKLYAPRFTAKIEWELPRSNSWNIYDGDRKPRAPNQHFVRRVKLNENAIFHIGDLIGGRI